MRHLVLALMILLLPLRSWTGDAMATSMATAELSALALGAPPADHGAAQRSANALLHSDAALDLVLPLHHNMQHATVGSALPAMQLASLTASVNPIAEVAALGLDCGGHGMGQSTDEGAGHSDGAHSGSDGCGACSSCQVCHTVALAQPAAASLAALLPSAVPARVPGLFASADAARRQKPPIS